MGVVMPVFGSQCAELRSITPASRWDLSKEAIVLDGGLAYTTSVSPGFFLTSVRVAVSSQGAPASVHNRIWANTKSIRDSRTTAPWFEPLLYLGAVLHLKGS